jgi:ABC-type uncharacterized transport system ATPase subunit
MSAENPVEHFLDEKLQVFAGLEFDRMGTREAIELARRCAIEYALLSTAELYVATRAPQSVLTRADLEGSANRWADALVAVKQRNWLPLAVMLREDVAVLRADQPPASEVHRKVPDVLETMAKLITREPHA